jgi:hypothetical protein
LEETLRVKLAVLCLSSFTRPDHSYVYVFGLYFQGLSLTAGEEVNVGVKV